MVTRPVLVPARQGLTPLVGFPFSLVRLRSLCSVMAQRVSRHTVDLDVSGLAASNDRKEVSQFIVEHFAHFNIHAVQFVGTVAKVTFAVEASKQQVICHQSINTNGVHCAVRGRGVVFARRMFLLTITPWRVTRSLNALLKVLYLLIGLLCLFL